MGSGVCLCIFGVVRNYLLGYLMYLWLNPGAFRAVAAFPWCWGCSSLFLPLPLLVWPCSPSGVPCALGIVTSCTDRSFQGPSLPGSSFSSLVWWEQLLLKSVQVWQWSGKLRNAPSPVSYTGNRKLETKPAFPIKAAIVRTAALD